MKRDGLILTFDPGAHSAAWACAREREIKACGFIGWKPGEHPGELERRFRASAGWEPMRVIIETPQVYRRGRRGRVDPNDLIAVACTVGAIEQALGPHVGTIERVWPHKWKGSVDGDVMLDRIEGFLHASERGILHATKWTAGELHNVVDAVGLALWAAGRLEKWARLR